MAPLPAAAPAPAPAPAAPAPAPEPVEEGQLQEGEEPGPEAAPAAADEVLRCDSDDDGSETLKQRNAKQVVSGSGGDEDESSKLTGQSGSKFFENTVRNALGHIFNNKIDSKLDTVVICGRRGFRRTSQNLGIFSTSIASKLAVCIDRLSVALSSRQGQSSSEGPQPLRGRINLSLLDCAISHTQLETFKTSLRCLRRLDLSGNPLGSRGALLLAEAVKSCRLVSLKLANVHLVDLHVHQMRLQGVLDLEGFRSLMFSLAVDETLEHLDLSCNLLGGTSTPRTYGSEFGYKTHEEYGTDSMKILAYYMHVNRSIRQLNILSNGFEDSLLIANMILSAARLHPTCESLCGADSHRLSRQRAQRRHALRLTSLGIPNFIQSPLLLSPPPTLCYRSSGLVPFSGRMFGAERSLFQDIVVLDLSDNVQFGDGLVHLCDALLDNSALRTRLSLREVELRKVGATNLSMTALVRLLNATLISRIDVGENRSIGDAGVRILATGIAGNAHLRTLQMKDVGLTARGVPFVAIMLQRNTVISTLDVGQNSITCVGVYALESALRSNKTLTSLCLSNAEIQSQGTLLMASVLQNSALVNLDLSCNVMCGRRSDNTFDPKPVIQIGDALQASNRTLTSLNLSKSDIGARSTRRIMTALIENPFLRTLIIDSCNISEEGASHVGEALPDLVGLETLHLSSCGVGPIGCQRIFLGLIHNSSLTSLDLSSNQLTGYHFGENMNQMEFDLSSVSAISTGLARNTVLRYLNLSNNRCVALFYLLSTLLLLFTNLSSSLSPSYQSFRPIAGPPRGLRGHPVHRIHFLNRLGY